MHPKLKSMVYEAIERALNRAAEESSSYWDEYLHPDLVFQMTNAAELVFDASQEAQRYRLSEEVVSSNANNQ